MIAVEILLAVSYFVLAHIASATNTDSIAISALLTLLLVLLLKPLFGARWWAWLVLLVAIAGIYWLQRIHALLLPMMFVPVLIMSLIAFGFLRTLQAGRLALITRMVSAVEGMPAQQLPSALMHYSRRLTLVWGLLLALLALLNLLLALCVVPQGVLARIGIVAPMTVTAQQWSWLANIGNYFLIIGFFVLEYFYRRGRFEVSYNGFWDFGRRLAALGPDFWRGFWK